VKYHDQESGVTENELGIWIGMAENVGQEMCYLILKSNGHVVTQSTVCQLMKEEW
jgi:hypothetical protein